MYKILYLAEGRYLSGTGDSASLVFIDIDKVPTIMHGLIRNPITFATKADAEYALNNMLTSSYYRRLKVTKSDFEILHV